MLRVSGDQAFGFAGQGYFKKWFVRRIWKSERQRITTHDMSLCLDLFHHRLNLFETKLKLRSPEDIGVFTEDAGIETEAEAPRGNHPDDFTRWTERR